jgi:methionine-rich copper-binding protein CopC
VAAEGPKSRPRFLAYPPAVIFLTRARRLALVAASLSAFLLLPGLAAAHAELVRAIPADGATVTEPVTFVSGRYSEDLKADSNLRILDAAGNTVATGGVDPNNDRVMVARPASPLTEGTFTVRSTAISAVDDHPERVTWTFTVAVPATPSPTPAGESISPAPSAEPTTEPTASATASPTPSASRAPGSNTGSGSDVILPIIAALAIITTGAAVLLSRGRRSGSA